MEKKEFEERECEMKDKYDCVLKQVMLFRKYYIYCLYLYYISINNMFDCLY